MPRPGGDAETVARLVLQHASSVWASGRSDTVLRWMEWFEAHGLIERFPAIAVHGALMHALVGRPGDTERWAAAAEATTTTGTLPDGNTVEATLAYLRALLCRDGPTQMRRDAGIALNGLAASSPYRATMLHAEGVSYLLEGDPDRADASFAHAVDAARAETRPFVPVLLAERGIAAIETDDWAAADTFAEQALAMMRDAHYDDYWTSALVYAWVARVALQRGQLEQARQLVARAARLRPLLNYALPVVSTQALLEMARVYVGLADPAGARAVLRQANDIVQQRPALGTLTAVADELRSKVDALRARGRRGIGPDDGGAPPPTAAAHAPLVPRDRRAAVPLAAHDQDPSDLDLPQARRLLTQRDDHADRRARPARTRVMTRGSGVDRRRLTFSDGRSSCSRAVRLGPPRCRRRTARRR